MSIIKEYHIATRDDVVKVAEKLSDYIVEHLRQGKPVPVINIYGSEAGGKSIFWDVAIQKILAQTAIFVARKSESYQTVYGDIHEARLYETWVGHNDETGKDLKVFVCNIRASDAKAHSLDMQALENGEFQNFGDVIMLTNAPNGFFKGNYPVLNVAVTALNRNNPDATWERHIAYH